MNSKCVTMQINYVLRPDWRYQKAESTFPFRLWISYLDKRDNYKTTLEVSRDDYEKLIAGKNLSAELRQLRDDLRKIQTGIDNYLEKVTEFEFDSFQKDFVNYNPLFVQRKKKMGYRQQREAPLIIQFMKSDSRFYPKTIEARFSQCCLSISGKSQIAV